MTGNRLQQDRAVLDGTRHRAALGISEQTDAVAVVVSEETGSIGLVERGRIVRNLDEDRLRSTLGALLGNGSVRRLPASADALRRGLPARGKSRLRRTSDPAAPAAAAPAPAAAPAAAAAPVEPATTARAGSGSSSRPATKTGGGVE
jgi:diadenylate cyclase